MTGFFQQYLQMALAGSLVLVVLLFARLLLKRMPKRFMCFLWMIALFRLLCPYTIEGPVPKFWEREASIEDAGQTDTEGVVQRPVTVREPLREQQMGQDWRPGDVMQGDSSPEISKPGNETVEKEPLEEEPLEQEVVDASEEKPSEGVEITPEGEREPGNAEALTHATQNLMEYLFLAAAYVWIIGSLCMAVFLAWKYIRTGSALRESTPLTTRRGIRVRQSDFPGVPMVFGIFQPCIYVPYGFDCEKEQMILEHETVHIRHGDILCKLLSHIALCVHWWNPLVWLGVSLFHKDMEMACDEAVLEQLTGEGRAEYSRMLLQYAAKRSGLALPMGFGESNTEERIRNILGKKKLPVWGTGLAFVLVVALGICIATKPHEPKHGGEEQPTQAEGSGTETEEPGTDAEDSSLEFTVDTSAEDGTEASVVEPDSSTVDENPIFIENAWKVNDTFLDRWKEVLREQGLEEEAEKLRLVGIRNEQNKWWNSLWKDRKDLGASELLFCTVSDKGEIMEYLTSATIYRTDEGFYAEKITENPPFSLTSEKGFQSMFLFGLPFVDVSLYPEEKQVIQYLAEIYSRENPEKYGLLPDPVTAIKALLNLSGEGEFVPDKYNDGYVRFLMKNQEGEQTLGFHVKKYGGYWYPDDVEYLEEGSYSAFQNNFQRCKEEEAFYEALSAEQLDEWSVLLNDFEEQEKRRQEGQELFLEMDHVGDAVLYRRYGDYKLVLRVKECVYPLLIYAERYPSLKVGDYDGDQKPEYVIESNNKSGTGFSGTELFVVELPEETNETGRSKGFEMSLFSDVDWLPELNRRITYSLDEEAEAYRIYVDGKQAYTVEIGTYLKENSMDSLMGFSFGNIHHFVLEDDQWYLYASAGLNTTFSATPKYEYGMVAVCPIVFHEDHTFSMGEIQIQPGE